MSLRIYKVSTISLESTEANWLFELLDKSSFMAQMQLDQGRIVAIQVYWEKESCFKDVFPSIVSTSAQFEKLVDYGSLASKCTCTEIT